MENKCICCGEIIPEGKLVCSGCAVTSVDRLMRENDDLLEAIQERDLTIAMLRECYASELAYRKQVAILTRCETVDGIFDDIVKYMHGDMICLRKSDLDAIKRKWKGE